MIREVNTRGSSRLHQDRRPGSIEEARSLIAYNERILATSESGQRRARAERMLVNVRPLLAELETDEASRLARIEASAPPGTFDGVLQRFREAGAEAREFDVAWNGTMGREGKSLSGDGMGSSLNPGPAHRLVGAP